MSDSRLDTPGAHGPRHADETNGEEEHDGLEAERDFLLRSLDDLDSELLAGNIDPDTYRVLHDDYTARASKVIRAIEAGEEREAKEARRGPPGLRVATIGGIVVFALLAAFLLAHAVGQRNAGGQITGDSQSNGATPTTASIASTLASAKAAAAAQPKSYSVQIDYARLLMQSGNLPTAIQQYLTASKVDPTQAEPLAWAGYLTTLAIPQTTDAATQQELITAADGSLQQAIKVDPTYAESYAFEGVLLAQAENKPCAGADDFKLYLAKASPSDPFYSQADTALTTAIKAGHCPASVSTPTTKP